MDKKRTTILITFCIRRKMVKTRIPMLWETYKGVIYQIGRQDLRVLMQMLRKCKYLFTDSIYTLHSNLLLYL